MVLKSKKGNKLFVRAPFLAIQGNLGRCRKTSLAGSFLVLVSALYKPHMLKTKTSKIIFFVISGISLFLNVLLIIATKNMSDSKDAISDCAKYAEKGTADKNYISASVQKVANDQIYDQCLKMRYGIDQKLQ